MSSPELSFSVNTDVTNPGQFFACCGLLELAHRLWPGVEGWFGNDAFHVSSSGRTTNPRALLQCLSETRLEALSGSKDPKLPPILLTAPFNLRLDWWLDSQGEKTIFGKMFSGQKRTMKDVQRLQNALKKALGREADCRYLFDPPWSAPLPGRFGVDPRTAWEALDVGFSPNDQKMMVDTYIIVELLGAIGLQVSPPLPRGTSFVYATWASPLCACVSRAAAAGIISLTRGGTHQFNLTKRGSYKGFDFATPIEGERS